MVTTPLSATTVLSRAVTLLLYLHLQVEELFGRIYKDAGAQITSTTAKEKAGQWNALLKVCLLLMLSIRGCFWLIKALEGAPGALTESLRVVAGMHMS